MNMVLVAMPEKPNASVMGLAVIPLRDDNPDFPALRLAIKALGGVDVLINNAGIAWAAEPEAMPLDKWQKVIDTNLTSLFNVTKQVIDGMVERGWGRIINISSVNGQKGAFGQTNYAAAKSGMHGFTKSLSLESAKKGVTVNTISPGYIGTKMVTAIPKEILDSKILPQIPAGRLGDQLRRLDGGGVDRDLVGTGIEQATHIVHGAHAPAHRQRDEHFRGHRLNDVQDEVSTVAGGGDV